MADVEGAPRNSQSYFQRVKSGEHHALPKTILRTIICILDITAIGSAAWILSYALKFRANPYIGYFSGPEVSPWAIGVCGVSFVFCLTWILVLLLRKPPAAMHPGIPVGCDLVLWLAFIVIALFTTAAIFSLSTFGDNGDGTLSDPGYGNSDYSGEYYLNRANNTWIYNITDVYSTSDTDSSLNGGYGGYFWNSTRDDWQLNTTKPSTSSVTRDCSELGFETCAEQDAYINMLWHTKMRRYATEILSGAAQWLCVLLHFVLFVWACVDTARLNARIKQERLDGVADRVIRDMQARGLITVHDQRAMAMAGPEGQRLMSGGGGSHSGGDEISPAPAGDGHR